MDFDEYKKKVLDPILEIEKRSKLKNALLQAFEESKRACEKLPPYESPYTNLNFEPVINMMKSTTSGESKSVRKFTGLEFDVSKFHVNSFYNIKSEHINFVNVKLCSVCYGELIFIVNEDNTVKHITITPKIVGKNEIIFEEVN